MAIMVRHYLIHWKSKNNSLLKFIVEHEADIDKENVLCKVLWYDNIDIKNYYIYK